MSWFNKIVAGIAGDTSQKKEIPENLWSRCSSCGATLFKENLSKNLNVCMKCDYHLPFSARQRLETFFDAGTYEELAVEIQPKDPLKFKDTKSYKQRLSSAQSKSGEKDALVVMKGKVNSIPLTAAAFEFSFIGGSMGSVVGHKFVMGVEHAIENRHPFVCFSASGGARMQEGLMSLFQMAKTSAAVGLLAEHKLPYIVVMTNPTYGGVTASLASLGDVNIAEPHADIGFAGKRVIKDTVKKDLPEGFQTSEFLLQHGYLDMIVHRHKIKSKVANILSILYRSPQALEQAS